MSEKLKEPEGTEAIPDDEQGSAGKPARPAKARRPIDILRERHGGPTAEMKEYFKTQNTVRKLLIEALQKSPLTIPELASRCQVAPDVIMWHMMAMRRYGRVIEDEVRGDYYSYRLKEV